MMLKLLSVLALGFTSNAWAGGFEPKTMQDKFEPNIEEARINARREGKTAK